MKTNLEKLLEIATEKVKANRKLATIEQVTAQRKTYEELLQFATKNNLTELDVEKAWTAATNHIR